MSITYKNSGPWGTGVLRTLTSLEVDDNFYDLDSRTTVLESGPSLAVGISDFSIIGDSLTIDLTDGTTRGPFILPIATPNFRGQWQAFTGYLVNDYFTASGKLWGTITGFTSGATFDSGSSDIQAIFSFPATPVSTISSSGYTPTILDANNYLRFTNPFGSSIVTVPSDESMAPFPFDVDTEIHIRDQTASGGVSVAWSPPVTVNVPYGYLPQTAKVGGTLTLKKVDVDEWDLMGLLAIGSPVAVTAMFAVQIENLVQYSPNRSALIETR